MCFLALRFYNQGVGFASCANDLTTEDTEKKTQQKVRSLIPQIVFSLPSVVKLVPSQLFAIAFEVTLHLAQTVAPKLFAHRVSQHQRNHRFAYHAGRGHDRDV